MAWKISGNTDFNLNAGRNAFRSDTSFDDADSETIMRRNTAIRSFTESVDLDFPPTPELPPSLNIDLRYPEEAMKRSETSETIIERKPKQSLQEKISGTQKYPMMVPGPGHVDAEQELHASLLNQDDEGSESDEEISRYQRKESLDITTKQEQQQRSDRDHETLRREYSISTLERPRSTTPTSWCAIENYVESSLEANDEPPPITAKKQRIHVSIPSRYASQTKRRRKTSMSWCDFYETMSTQIPYQVRRSMSGSATSLHDYDGDILEEDPRYRNVAPPKPVIHRRSSTDWENFIDNAEFETLKSIGNNNMNKSDAKANDGDTSESLSFDYQTISDDRKVFPDSASSVEPFVNSAIDKKISTTYTRNSRDMEELETGTLTRLQEWSKNSEPGKKATADREDSAPQNDFNTEPKESFAVRSKIDSIDSANHVYDAQQDPVTSEIQSGTLYVTSSYTANDATAVAASRQETDDSTSYQQQTEEYQQYTYSYDEPHSQNFGAQNAKYEYSMPPYQDYEQQQQQQQQQNYQDYDQMNYATTYESYAQESAMNQHYTQQPIIMQHYDQQQPVASSDYGASQFDRPAVASDYSTSQYDQQPAPVSDYGTSQYYQQQPTALPGYSTAQYDQSQGYGYDNCDASYTTSYIVPTANDQSYAMRTETYPDNLEIAGETMNNYGTEQYQQPGDYRTPVVPQYIAPLFPTVISSEPNPFSWEAQENAASVTTLTDTNSLQPPQSSVPEQNEKTTKSDSTDVQNTEKLKQKPPSRPAPPSPSVERSTVAPPTRPPMPTKPKYPTESSLSQQSSSKLPESEPEEDAWTKFKKLTEKATTAMKTTEEKLKELEKTTAAKDIKDESYLSQIGGSQAFTPEHAYKQAREQGSLIGSVKEKKKMKHGKSKKVPEPEMTLAQEDDMDRAAMELAKKMAVTRIDLQDWKPPQTEQQDSSLDLKPDQSPDSNYAMRPYKSVDDKEIAAETGNIFKEPSAPTSFSQKPRNVCWAGFDDSQPAELPPSESGFFTNASALPVSPEKAFGDLDVPHGAVAPSSKLADEDYDPFNVCSADELVQEAKAKAAAAIAAGITESEISLFASTKISDGKDSSSPTEQDGSPASTRPVGFDDEFRVETDATPSPLYDEDDSVLLTDFPAKFTGDGWEMMVRYPIKKKIMGDRYWKPCYVRLRDNTLFLFDSKTEQKPLLHILLQATYSLSDPTLQAYDVYGKIHTVKLQCVSYKERVGIRPGQISRLVEGHVTKYGLPLEHTANCTVLLKFGSLNAAELFTFVATIEDILFRCVIVRNSTPLYKQDEVQIHCYDEYSAYVDKSNVLSDQKARVRLFCLAFVSGSPILEIGLNDRRRQGKEIVRRKDILPMYTERWIRFENVEFHNVVEQETFEKEQVIRFSPPDGCFFEVMRFRIRPPKNREKPLTVRCVMKIAGSKVEIRIEAMAAAQTEKTKDGLSSKGQVPCEDIQIRFPIPEAWIYLFREERRWGVGSVHAKVRRPGKVKNFKDRLMGTVHNIDNSLIEAAIGEAKYEHVFRALVWRIPRLPEKHHAGYKEHLLRCRFELSSFDLMPETFTPTCDVEFTMPLAMVSNTVVRSVSVEKHEDSDRVEKFVRYVAKCTYKVEIDYIQCSSDMDIDTICNPADNQESAPEPHKPMFNPDEVNQLHEGYRIDFSDAEIGANRHRSVDSSSDEEDDRRALPMIHIDPKGYGY